jgi:hypothetical protein
MTQCIYCSYCAVDDFKKLTGTCSEKTKKRININLMTENKCKEHILAPIHSYKWRVSKLTKGIK